jgi:hypothetical protein
MAGSYNHIVQKDGNLGSNKRITQSLENGGDVFEAVEEMYGMIWYLAGKHLGHEKQMVEDARKNYREGLKVAKAVNK